MRKKESDDMKFNAHSRTPKVKTSKFVKIMLAICFSLIVAFFVFMAIVCSLYTANFAPAILILTPVFVIAITLVIMLKDMDRAYVEIFDNKITVVDYYFGIKKIKKFVMEYIAYADVLVGYSRRVRGYRYSMAGCNYLVFMNNRGNYMFKIICVPETKQFFNVFLRQ